LLAAVNRDAVEEYAAWCEEAYSRQQQLLAELERLGPELEIVSAQLGSARVRCLEKLADARSSSH